MRYGGGLLKQPRPRRSAEVAMATSDEDPRALKKRIAQLEQQLKDRDDLIRLLAKLPKPRSEPPGSTPSIPAAKTRRRSGAKRGRPRAQDRRASMRRRVSDGCRRVGEQLQRQGRSRHLTCGQWFPSRGQPEQDPIWDGIGNVGRHGTSTQELHHPPASSASRAWAMRSRSTSCIRFRRGAVALRVMEFVGD